MKCHKYIQLWVEVRVPAKDWALKLDHVFRNYLGELQMARIVSFKLKSRFSSCSFTNQCQYTGTLLS